MDKIDLFEPRFTQAQVLKITPSLKAKDLQNWTARGVLEVEQNLGKGNRRLYSAMDAVKLRFMAGLVAMNIPASDCYSMSKAVTEYAATFHADYPAKVNSEGVLAWPIVSSLLEKYHRGYIFMNDNDYIIDIRMEELGMVRSVIPLFYIVVEIDQLLCALFNVIYRAIRNLPSREIGVISAASDEEREVMEQLATIQARLSQPKAKKGPS